MFSLPELFKQSTSYSEGGVWNVRACFLPGKVWLPEKMVMVSAGDSHTAALSESGQVTSQSFYPRTSNLSLISGLCLGHIQRQQRPNRPRGGHEGGEVASEGAGRGPRDQDRVPLGPPRHAQLRRPALDDGELRAGPGATTPWLKSPVVRWW